MWREEAGCDIQLSSGIVNNTTGLKKNKRLIKYVRNWLTSQQRYFLLVILTCASDLIVVLFNLFITVEHISYE